MFSTQSSIALANSPSLSVDVPPYTTDMHTKFLKKNNRQRKREQIEKSKSIRMRNKELSLKKLGIAAPNFKSYMRNYVLRKDPKLEHDVFLSMRDFFCEFVEGTRRKAALRTIKIFIQNPNKELLFAPYVMILSNLDKDKPSSLVAPIKQLEIQKQTNFFVSFKGIQALDIDDNTPMLCLRFQHSCEFVLECNISLLTHWDLSDSEPLAITYNAKTA